MSVAQAQRRNPEQVAILSADLQPRYEPNFAWKGICGLYQSLPALRGFWPCSSQIVTAQSLYLPDIANNYHCAAASVPLWGYDDLIPYVEFDGENDAFYYGDNAQFDITGTETTVVAAQRGLTLGAWVKSDALGGCAFLGKYNHPTDQRSYLLYDTGSNLTFTISAAGDAAITSASSALLIQVGVWHLMIGRFVPSTSVDVYLDNVKTTNSTAVPASIFNSTAEFNIGALNNHTTYWFDGKISMAFICAAALSDSIIGAIWQQTRAMYGR